MKVYKRKSLLYRIVTFQLDKAPLRWDARVLSLLLMTMTPLSAADNLIEYFSKYSLALSGGTDLSMLMMILAHIFKNSFSLFSLTVA